jgi:hypothetical protein
VAASRGALITGSVARVTGSVAFACGRAAAAIELGGDLSDVALAGGSVLVRLGPTASTPDGGGVLGRSRLAVMAGSLTDGALPD